MLRVILDIETAEEPDATVFNRVLFRLTKDELIYNAVFQHVDNGCGVSKDMLILKAKVLEWAREKNVTIPAIAEYLRMSIGSVKNLLYSKSLNICKKRAEQLERMMTDDAFFHAPF